MSQSLQEWSCVRQRAGVALSYRSFYKADRKYLYMAFDTSWRLMTNFTQNQPSSSIPASFRFFPEMSDNWDDDAPAGDDGWGDDAANDSWGDNSTADGGWGQAESSGWGESSSVESLPADVRISNTFYEAEDLNRTDPDAALAKYQEVINASSEISNITGELATCVFVSHLQTTLLNLRVNTNHVESSFSALLKMLPVVTSPCGFVSDNHSHILTLVSIPLFSCGRERSF